MTAKRDASIAGSARAAGAILARADGLMRRFEEDAAATADGPARVALARVASRLGASVVRPLHGLLGAPASPLPVAGVGRAAGESLHSLARDTTRLRVRAGGPPALLEATAALQDLACQVADDATRAARRAEFASLQTRLDPTIQSSAGGPYLVSNVERITDHLGVSVEPLAQVALCRCGASEMKPWCDGSHSAIGFQSEKAADRVPNRLDAYVGQRVTIHDNRGTCAHSGFCTDRAPAAFRTSAEPFVAPSGARVDEIVRAVLDCPSGALGYAMSSSDGPGRADQDRAPSIEISRDGPYRVTGAIALVDDHGRPEARNDGASLEHYSLCRCGTSQNKPFCSGMHWYADFHDPIPLDEPTLFQWAGGFPALLRLTRRFYETHVPEDPFLAPLFASMAPDHPERVAAWLGEVFGGPKAYSERYGAYDRMISQHIGKGLREEWRAHWVRLLCRAADDVGLPADAEFRAAFTAYLEWGSRIAVENSQPGVQPPPHMPVPRWWWVDDAYPWSRPKAVPIAGEPVAMDIPIPGPDEELSFATNIKPLFRARDRESMRFAFDLWSRDDVAANASAILERLRAGTMPCDGKWPSERIELLERWAAAPTDT